MKIELAANPNAAYASEDGSAIDCDVLIFEKTA